MTRNRLSNVAFRSKATEAGRATLLDETMQAAGVEVIAGNHAAAADLFRTCLETDPRHPDAWSGLASTLRRLGDMAGASQAYRALVAIRPAMAASHFGLAETLRRQGLPEQALESCETGLRLDATIGEGHIVRSAIRKDLGQQDEAIADLRLILSVHPGLVAVHILLCDMVCGFDRLDEAVDALRTAIEAAPENASLHQRLARILVGQRRTKEAIAASEAVARLQAKDAEAHRSLAVLYQEQGRPREAFESYQRALDLDPKFARAYTNLATLIMADYRLDLATSIFRAVVALTPTDATAYHNLGVILRLQGLLEEAVVNFRQSLSYAPDYFESLTELCHIRQHFCEWDGLRAQQESLFDASYRRDKPVPPFAVITSALSSPQDQLACARAWSRSLKKKAGSPLASHAPRPSEKRHLRLKIGYVSTDFHNHATAMLIVELLEKHDKTKFEIIAYSFGPDDGSAMRRRLVNAFDRFVELRGISNAEATRRIHADDIDILIDLKGYTQDAHTEIFAARAAPIQVSYLGYPGTMGADFIDYMIVDSIVAPLEQAALYDEKLVHLPNCYQPNDRKRIVADRTPTRLECGLPEQGFVFCCFNNSYKITDTMFEIWMRLLQQTPGSVLWLLESNRVVADNLRHEANLMGVASDRLIFAPRLAADRHLARMRCADLFLDTLPVNAHTTASEALWVGLPVLTCVGTTFISRVAGSLLHAVGLQDLATRSLADYEAKALQLSHDPAGTTALRETLLANRLTAPLFDTDRYTRNFEAALSRMAEIRDADRRPEAFVVADRD